MSIANLDECQKNELKRQYSGANGKLNVYFFIWNECYE